MITTETATGMKDKLNRLHALQSELPALVVAELRLKQVRDEIDAVRTLLISEMESLDVTRPGNCGFEIRLVDMLLSITKPEQPTHVQRA